MSHKPVILRELARRDVGQALDYYIGQQAYDEARHFVDRLAEAFDHLSRYPESGSQRYAQELNLAGVRHWPLAGFPYLFFYVEGQDHLDVWRVLHAGRDIAEWLRAE